ncbi:hypothetical protein [Methylomagnum sp.]
MKFLSNQVIKFPNTMDIHPKFPDFLILGAPKAGTTAMFRALEQHPRIFCSPAKEPRYFINPGWRPDYRDPGAEVRLRTIVVEEADYLRLFSQCPPDAKAGEASTAYLQSAEAPAHAVRYVPNVRLITVLRHPVERGIPIGCISAISATRTLAILKRHGLRKTSASPKAGDPPGITAIMGITDGI